MKIELKKVAGVKKMGTHTRGTICGEM